MFEEDEEDWWSNDRWRARISVEEMERGPNVIIPVHERERLAKRWKNAVFVKLLGRMINADFLEKKLQQLWAKEGKVESMDIGHGFFVVRFAHEKDYELALLGGPWLIYDHYIAVQPWRPEFDPDEEVISKVAAWIRFDKLPVDYYDKGILHVLGSQVGRVLKMDPNTKGRKKGRFARLCIELNLNAQLKPYIMINGKARCV